tara:strand:+ start:263 stop:460 length:198 start_codon:yes stop_codon:yes gene_type:complete
MHTHTEKRNQKGKEEELYKRVKKNKKVKRAQQATATATATKQNSHFSQIKVAGNERKRESVCVGV